MTSARRQLYMVSLGCPKNRVDSEVMLGLAMRRGYQTVDDPTRAHVIVVNTCGFIDTAKQESIDVIFEMAAYKETARCERLIVTGCLSQRHHRELAAEIPEIDCLLGSGDVGRIADALDGKLKRESVGSEAGYLVHATDPRVISTARASAYVIIAEGCDRRCGFWVIPTLRGKHRSRPVGDVVQEVERLASQGVLELNLVSQDTICYGQDLGPNPRSKLAELVRRVADVAGIRWVRVMYLYPDVLDDALIELLSGHPRVLPYVDMPMQHASDTVLRRMLRGHSNARLRRTVEKLRARIPGLTMRTAFIVGFPGETDRDFNQLCEFVRWAKFERLGVFRYSDEKDAISSSFDAKVSSRTSYNRARALMALQRPVARAANRAMLGRTIEVMVEGRSSEHELVMIGRHGGQAPEIDGQVYFTGAEVRAGELRRARVVKATDYDLVVEPLDEEPLARSRTSASAHRRRSLPVLK